MSDERKRLSDAGRRVYDAAFEEPFDETKLRDARAAEWLDLVAAATSEGFAADYDEVLGDLLVALVE
jgi:hypothetical protein